MHVVCFCSFYLVSRSLQPVWLGLLTLQSALRLRRAMRGTRVVFVVAASAFYISWEFGNFVNLSFESFSSQVKRSGV